MKGGQRELFTFGLFSPAEAEIWAETIFAFGLQAQLPADGTPNQGG
jgi:hypothetical protein